LFLKKFEILAPSKLNLVGLPLVARLDVEDLAATFTAPSVPVKIIGRTPTGEEPGLDLLVGSRDPFDAGVALDQGLLGAVWVPRVTPVVLKRPVVIASVIVAGAEFGGD